MQSGGAMFFTTIRRIDPNYSMSATEAITFVFSLMILREKPWR